MNSFCQQKTMVIYFSDNILIHALLCLGILLCCYSMRKKWTLKKRDSWRKPCHCKGKCKKKKNTSLTQQKVSKTMEDLIEALSYCIFFCSKLSTIYSSVGDTAFALFIFNFLLNVYLFIYFFFNSLIWYNFNLRKPNRKFSVPDNFHASPALPIRVIAVPARGTVLKEF